MKTYYRVSRDNFFSDLWSVQSWRWYWPFWIEEIGLLKSEKEARAMIDILNRNY